MASPRARRAARSSSSSEPAESPPGRDEAGRFVHHDGDAWTRRPRARAEEEDDDVAADAWARARARVVMRRASGCLGTRARFFASEGEARRFVLRARSFYTRDERLRVYANESFVFARGDVVRCAHACEAKS